MNGNQHYVYWSANAAAVAEKLKETAGYKKLLFTLAMAVLGVTVFVQAVALVVFSQLPVYPTHPDWTLFVESLEIGGSYLAAQDIAYLLMWLSNDIIVYVPPLLAFGIIFRKRLDYQKPGEPYEYKSVWVFPFFLAGIAIATGSSIFMSIIAMLFSGVFGGDSFLPEVFQDVLPQTNIQLLVMLVTVGVIAPICEEVIYRHLLLKPLRRYGDLQAVIITSVLFGFFHGNLTQFLYTAMVGFILGVAAVKANSVTPAIFIHMMNNVYVVFSTHLLTLSESGEISLSIESLGVLNICVLALGVIALAIMGVKDILTIENYNPNLSPRERVHILSRRPSIIIMTIILILATIIVTLG